MKSTHSQQNANIRIIYWKKKTAFSIISSMNCDTRVKTCVTNRAKTSDQPSVRIDSPLDRYHFRFVQITVESTV